LVRFSTVDLGFHTHGKITLTQGVEEECPARVSWVTAPSAKIALNIDLLAELVDLSLQLSDALDPLRDVFDVGEFIAVRLAISSPDLRTGADAECEETTKDDGFHVDAEVFDVGILDHAIDFGSWNDDRREPAFGLRRCFPRTLLILDNPILLFHRLIQGAVITALFCFA